MTRKSIYLDGLINQLITGGAILKSSFVVKFIVKLAMISLFLLMNPPCAMVDPLMMEPPFPYYSDVRRLLEKRSHH